MDRTGLARTYDVGVDLKPEAGAGMFTLWQGAPQDRLGLELEGRKDAAEVLVIDHAERIPVAN